MSTVYLVSKSSDDAAILRRMLPAAIRRTIDFVVADDDPVAAISTARTLLALGGQPVGLVVDAYTRDTTQIRSKRRTIEALLERAATSIPWKLFIAVPDLHHVWNTRLAVNQIPLGREIREFVRTVGNQP
jgi:hypothetical protein